MKSVDFLSCDFGIAHAIKLISPLQKDKNSGFMIHERIQKLLSLSGHLNTSISTKPLAVQNDEEDKKINQESGTQLDNLLPPMMALEHPNKSLRLKAVSSLEASINTKGDITEVASSLMRRFISDNDILVVAKSVKTLLSFHSQGILPDSFFYSVGVAKQIVIGLNKWLITSDMMSKCDVRKFWSKTT